MKKSTLLILLALPFELSIIHHARAMKEISIEEASRQVWETLKNKHKDYYDFNDLDKTLIRKQLNIHEDLNSHFDASNPQHLKHKAIMNSLNEENITPFLYAIQQKKIRHIGHLSYNNIPDFNALFNNKNYLQHVIDLKDPDFLGEFLGRISINKNFNEVFNLDTNTPLATYVIDEYTKTPTDTTLWDTIKVLFNKSPRFERLTLFTAIEKNSQGFVEKLITDKPGLLTARHDTTQQTPLHFALVQKQNNIARYLLNTKPENATTLLFQETESGNAALVQDLITLNPKLIGARNASQATPLHIAVRRGHKNIITYFLENGADPLVVDNDNQNTFAYAQLPQSRTILKSIITEYVATSAGKERIKTLLQQAIEENNTAVAKDLLTYGARADTVIIHGRTPELDQTILWWALTNNDAELASIAVRNGAYPNVTFGKNQDTPLHWAVRNENQELFDALLEKGAKVDQTNARKETPLQVARTFQRTKMIKDLINHAQTIHTQTDERKPLPIKQQKKQARLRDRQVKEKAQAEIWHAANSGDITKLPSEKISVNIVNENNETPLHIAAGKGHAPVVAYLIQHGASINPLNTLKQTPLHYAAKYNHADIVVLLLKTKKANSQRASLDGSLALHHAAFNGNVTIARALITYKTKKSQPSGINHANNNGATPLHIAIQNGHKDLIAFLLNNGANPLTVDKNNQNTLAYAQSPQTQDLLKPIMIEYVANLIATSTDQEHIKKLLEQHIITPDGQGQLSNPLLHLAITHKKPVVINSLIELKFPLNSLNAANQTPLLHAITDDNTTAAVALLKAGADYSIKDSNGNAAVHLAVIHNNKAVFDELAELAAPVDTVNNDGQTPLDLALGLPRDADQAPTTPSPLAIKILNQPNAEKLLTIPDKKNTTLLDYITSLSDTHPLKKSVLSTKAFATIQAARALQKKHTTLIQAAQDSFNLPLIKKMLKKSNLDINALCTSDTSSVRLEKNPIRRAIRGIQTAVDSFVYYVTDLHTKWAQPTLGKAPLHVAAQHGALPVVDYLLHNGATITLPDAQGNTPLDYAIANDHETIVHVLLHRLTKLPNEYVNHNSIRPSYLEHTFYPTELIYPLHAAALYGNDAAVAYFMKKGYDINRPDHQGNTPLHKALETFARTKTQQPFNGITFLVEAGANLLHHNAKKQSPLDIIATLDQKAQLQPLVQQALNTALMNAVQQKDMRRAVMYRDQGAQINAQDAAGNTPLHLAAQQGDLYVVFTLLKLDANPAALNKQSKQPFHVSANTSVSILLSAVTQKDTHHQSQILHQAIETGNLLLVQLLLEDQDLFGAYDVNDRDQFDTTPLAYAVERNHYDIAQYLLNNNASIFATVAQQPLYFYAKKNNFMPLSTLVYDELVKHCTKAFQDKDDKTITRCVEHGILDRQQGAALFVRLDKKTLLYWLNFVVNHRNNLINNPHTHSLLLVDVNVPDERNKTLLHHAIEENNTAVAKVLLTHGALANTITIYGRTRELDQTLLSWALTNNNPELAIAAVRNGAYPNVTFGKNQDTPLHWAVRNDNYELFDALLAQGATIDQANARKETPLQVARTFQRTKMIKDLINHAQTIHTQTDERKPLPIKQQKKQARLRDRQVKEKAQAEIWHAANSGDITKLPSEKISVNIVNEKHETPLHIAAGKGHARVVAYLIKHGASINPLNTLKQTPLHYAVKHDHADIVTMLLKTKDANSQRTSTDGSLALHHAAFNGNVTIATALIKHQTKKHATNPINHANNNGNTPLHMAAKQGHVDMVTYLLNQNASIDLPNNHGNTPLHLAAQYGHDGVVDLLLQDETFKNKRGYTPLDLACQHNHINVIEILESNAIKALWAAARCGDMRLIKLAEPLIKKYPPILALANEDQTTPLHIAAANGHLDVVNYLIAHKAPVNSVNMYNDTPLILAVDNNRNEVVAALLKAGATSTISNVDGFIPLHLAAWRGNIDIAQLLLKDNATIIDRTTNDGFTPLSFAVQEQQLPMITFLLKAGAQINLTSNDFKNILSFAATQNQIELVTILLEKQYAPNKDKNTPLHLATLEGMLDVVEFIVRNNPNLIDTQNNQNNTPLHLAAQYGHNDIASFLLNKKAYYKASNKLGEKPLHLAAQKGHLSIVQLLLDQSTQETLTTDVNVSDQQRNTPLHLAVRNEHMSVIELLLNNNAHVNASNQDKNTPLHLAADNGYVHIVTFLLDKGALINAQNKDGNTPLHLAKEKEHRATIEFLRVHKDTDLSIKNKKGETALTFKRKK